MTTSCVVICYNCHDMMVLLNVYSQYIKIKYKSTIISRATVLIVLTELFKICFSFIIAYNTGGFWIKKDFYYEQPKVSIQGEYILMAKTNSDKIPIIVCSTNPFYKRYLQHYDFCSIIKFREIDEDFDGRNDEIILEISLNLYNFTLDSIDLVLPIKYQLSETCPLKMQSLIFYQHKLQQLNLVTELHIFAHLNLFQVSAIFCDKKFADIYNQPVIPTGTESKSFATENIIANYLNRKVTTHLRNVYTITTTEIKKTFKIKLQVKYPENKIYFKPKFWQVIKTAWIQYFAIYIILSWLSGHIRKYIFENRLVWYYEESPLKIKKCK